MTIQLVDSFDMYNGVGNNTGLQAKWAINGGTSPVLAAGRFGGQCVSCSPSVSGSVGASSFSRQFPTAIATATVAFAVNLSTLNTMNYYFLTLLDSASGYQIGLRETAAGALTVSRATDSINGTQLGITASGIIVANTWHFVELTVTISDTVGTVTLVVDGATVMTLTGQDTKNTANTNVQFMQFGHPGNSSSVGVTYKFDDLYVTDGASLGEARAETLRATADTATKTWTPNSGGTNFSRVNETLVDGDTTYVQDAVVGDRDLYTIGSLSSTPATIHAVQVVSFAEKTDAATRSIYNSVKSGATDSDGSAFNLAASYGRFDRLLPTDPNTSAAWLAAAVNALQIGPKVAV